MCIKNNKTKCLLIAYILFFNTFSSGSWEIILCHTCGSNGTHLLCSSLKCNEVWYCSTCHDVAGKGFFTSCK